MGHGREEIGLCLIGVFRFHRRDLQTLVQVEHIEQVAEEQDKQARGNDYNQQPVFDPHIEILRRHQAQQRPSDSVGERGIGDDAFLPV